MKVATTVIPKRIGAIICLVGVAVILLDVLFSKFLHNYIGD